MSRLVLPPGTLRLRPRAKELQEEGVCRCRRGEDHALPRGELPPEGLLSAALPVPHVLQEVRLLRPAEEVRHVLQARHVRPGGRLAPGGPVPAEMRTGEAEPSL